MQYRKNTKAIKAFGENLKKIRKRKNVTQEDLAFESGIDIRQIGRIERGTINTSINNVFDIATALKIEPAELFKF